MLKVVSLLIISLVVCDTTAHEYDSQLMYGENELEKIHNQKYFTDLWGYKVDWRNPADGWNEKKRTMMLAAKKLIIRQMQVMPKFSKLGYKKMKIPKELHLKLLEARNQSKLIGEECIIPNYFNNCYKFRTIPLIPFKSKMREIPGKYMYINTSIFRHSMNLTDFVFLQELTNRTMMFEGESLTQLKDEIVKSLKPKMENWCARKLTNDTVIYGIRRYLKGSWLALHLDHLLTHVLSVILQVCQMSQTEEIGILKFFHLLLLQFTCFCNQLTILDVFLAG